MKQESTTTKSKTKTFKNFAIGIGIVSISFLLYVHDSGWFKGKEGFSGFSSLRVGVWVVSMFIMNLVGWIIAFINSKGKGYRFALLVPIIMIVFQLSVYLLDARRTYTNEFTTKTLVNLAVAIGVVVAYYLIKRNRPE